MSSPFSIPPPAAPPGRPESSPPDALSPQLKLTSLLMVDSALSNYSFNNSILTREGDLSLDTKYAKPLLILPALKLSGAVLRCASVIEAR